MQRISLYWKNKPFKTWRLAGFIVIVGFLILRLSTWMAAESSNTQTATEHFNAVVQNDASRLRNRFEVYADTLYSGRALFLAHESVSRQDWTEFINAQDVSQRYPGIYRLAYVSVIPRSQTAGLVAQLNASRLPGEQAFTIYPASTDPQLAVVNFVAPKGTSQEPIGYDLFTSPVRTAMLNAARDSGLPRASQPLSLVGEPTDMTPSSNNILLAMPVYHQTTAFVSLADRRAALTGYIIMSLRTTQLLDPILKAGNSLDAVAVAISTNQRVIYRTGSQPSASSLQKTVTLDVAGQQWQIHFSAPSSYGLSQTAALGPSWLLWGIIPSVLALFLAFYFGLHVQILRRHQRTYQQEQALDNKDQ